VTRRAGIVREERGIALVAAMAVLLVLLLLTTSVVAVAVMLRNHSSRDRSSSRALGAAEAGLQIARYRVNRMPPKGQKTSSCPYPSPAISSGTDCEKVEVDLGNGGSAAYYVSQAYTTTPPCGSAAPAAGYWVRCITSTGTVGAVSRRLQARVDASVITGKPVLCSGASSVSAGCSFAGIHAVSLDGENKINAYVASDGEIHLKGKGDEILGCAPSPTGASKLKLEGNSCPLLSPPQTNSWASQVPTAQSLNENGINTGVAGDSCTGYTWTSTVAEHDSTHPCGNSNAQAGSALKSGRILKLGKNASLTLCSSGGVCAYNFCQIELEAGAQLNFGSSATVVIFMDSSTRSGSGCASITVTIKTMAGASIANGGQAANLQVYVWGNSSNPANSKLEMNAASGITAIIWAPNSDFVSSSSHAKIIGALVAYEIGGSDVGLSFEPDSSISNPSSGQSSTGLFTPTLGTWHECTATATGSPESGC
jgi:Tfp pilus assembly protein PilX